MSQRQSLLQSWRSVSSSDLTCSPNTRIASRGLLHSRMRFVASQHCSMTELRSPSHPCLSPLLDFRKSWHGEPISTTIS
eukprot:6237928-Alexandrium_andersonii.AAC.1